MISENDSGKVMQEAVAFIRDAVFKNASDLHFEVFEKKVRVRFRIDGVLKTVRELDLNEYLPICECIKVMAGVNANETRMPQDGRIKFPLGEKTFDIRVAFISTIHGENMCMRIFDPDFAMDMDRIGLNSVQRETLRNWCARQHGTIFFAGPSGSGKTTNLYMLTQDLAKESLKVCTVEDPVVYNLEGVTQISVNPQIGLTFAVAIKSLLLQDPDVIVVGEIRDYETCMIIATAAIMGHLVLSGLHSNTATDGLLRLKMGMEPAMIKDTLIGIVAQRLVRVLCKECRTKYIPDDMTLKNLNIQKQEYYKAAGCAKCNNTGYSGRIGIFELYAPSSTVMNMMLKGASSEEIRAQAISEGMRTLFDDGIAKAAQGITSIDEVVRVLPSESATVQ